MGKISASDEIRIQSSDFARTWFSIQKNHFKISKFQDKHFEHLL